MKKILTFIAALMFCTGLFAEETILATGPWEAQGWMNQPTLLSDGGTELANIGAQAGDVINFYIEPTKEDWACQIWEGHWGPIYASICAPSMASTLGYIACDLSANGGKYALTLTPEMIDAALTPQGWGGTFLINGDGVVVTKLTLVTSTIFVDDQSGLTFLIIDSDDVNNVMVIFTKNGYPTYSGDVVIPSTVNYHDTTFTVTQIGSNAFAGCSNLTSVTIPSSVTTIGEDAFGSCSGLTSINVDAANTHFCSVNGVLFNYAKDTLIHYPMGSIRTEYTIPNSVTTIGYKAFYDCSKLTSVTIPNSVTTIGDNAFFNILNIVYNGTASGSPWGAKCINGYVDGYFVYSDASKTILCGCSTAAMGEITIPNSVIIIGESAFHYCRDLTSVTIPNSVITIGYGAFDECSGLTSVTIGNSVTTIEGWAFHSCSSLTSVTIPNSVTTIGFGAFFECSGLTSVTIGNSVKTIEMQAFAWCSSLTSVTIPNSVTTIGENAFSGCSSLTSVTIPNSVTTIGGNAFAWCSSLTSISIPNSVTTIGGNAFLGSGLRDVSVAWASSDQLPTMGVGVFDNIANWTGTSAATLHVPEGTKSIYENADQWKEFGTIIESIEPQVGNKFGVDGLWYEILTMGETNTVKVISHLDYKNLQTVSIPNSITFRGTKFDVVVIGGDAFSGCSSLTSVTIPNSVTTIGDYAFSYCSSLTSVTIGNSVTTIGDAAFEGCRGLTSVSIPNSVTTIGNYAFSYCSSLTSVTIPNSVTAIGNHVFGGCSGLTSVTIPNSVTTIGKEAFYLVNNIVYNGTATGSPWGAKCVNGYVDGYLVYSDASKTTLCGCSSAATGEIIIPNSVTTIGEYAFYHCSGLTSVTIPNSVTTIGEWAFYNCSGLTSVTIPNSVKTIGYCAFSYVNNIEYNGTATWESDDKYWGAKCVNGYVDGYLVYSDATKTTLCGCFTAATGEIIIPNSVTTIGERAFAYCSGLTSVIIPNSVTTIGYNAFLECSNLASINIPESVTSIGESVFSGCTSLPIIDNLRYADTYLVEAVDNTLSTYTIKEETKWIGEFAFSWCRGLTSITIPNSVTTIGSYAFYGCSGLTSVAIPNSVTMIGEWAFASCSGLTSVTIGNSVTEIGRMAFSDCINLTSIAIPNSVITIGDYAFQSCSSLTSVAIGNSVKTIGERAFLLCNALVSIDVDAANTHYCSIDGVLFNYAKDTLILYPASNTRTEYSIPNSVTTLGYSAFRECSNLTSVTIPNSVTTIEECAFYWCEVLTSITCYAVIPPKCVGAVFSGINYNAKVYVPASALVDYQSAEVWKDMLLLPIAADVTPMDDENPIILPTDQDVTITWAITDGADTYMLTISKNGETVCVLTFNAQGQLLNIAFAAPGHDGSHQAPAATLTAQGYQFTVTGLDPGTAYDYSVTATDAGGQTIAEHKGNFSTTGGTGLNTLPYEGKEGIGSKYFHNGNLIIERNGIKYTATGQKVR